MGVLLKAQSTALGKPLDTERLRHISENLQAVKKIRNTEVATYAARSEHLWLGDFNTVRASCRREVVGFLSAGSMAYTTGACVGYGFVAHKGLVAWLAQAERNPKQLVLTRETSSTQYRFASLTVL